MTEYTGSGDSSNKATGGSQRFVRDIIWVGLAQVFNSMIVGIVTMPALTKSYSSDIYGIWVQVTVTVGLLSPLVALQLGQAAVRFLSGEQDRAKRRAALGAMLFAVIISSCLAVVAANLLASQTSDFLFASPDHAVLVRWTFIWVLVSALFDFLTFYFYARNRTRMLSIRQVALSIVTMSLIVGLASRGASVAWIVASSASVQAVFTLVLFSFVLRDTGLPKPNVSGLRTFLAFSVPLVPSAVLLWTVRFIDRYFITHFLGLSETGVYSSSATLGGLMVIFYLPISLVLYPLVSRLWEEKRFSEVRDYLEHSSRLFLTLALPAAVGIAMLSQPLLGLLTTSEYLAGRELVLLVALGTVFLGAYQINISVVLLIKRTRLLPFIMAAASIVTVVMNIVLIPRIGIVGAPIANLASYGVLATVATLWARKAVGYSLSLAFLCKVIAATLTMGTCLYFLDVQGVPGMILSVIAGAAIFGIVLLVLRAFSEEDKRLIRKTLSGLISRHA